MTTEYAVPPGLHYATVVEHMCAECLRPVRQVGVDEWVHEDPDIEPKEDP